MAKKPFDIRSGTRKDSKGKVLRAPKDNSSETANFRWWECDEDHMAASIIATLREIQKNQSGRIEMLTVATRLAGSPNNYSLIGTVFNRSSGSMAGPQSQRMSYNLVSSVIDTLESKMAKNKIIPTYITNGAVWDNQKKAEDLTKFTQGLFYQHKIHPMSIEAFSDAETWGDGFLYVHRDGNKVAIERDLPHEIWVDRAEGDLGQPTQLHRVKIMTREKALAKFPELAEEILKAHPVGYEQLGTLNTVADLIQVVYSWHLRSGPEETDGVMAICIGEKVHVTPWDKDYFPFPHYRYAKRKVGWYGQGIPERLMNIQGEINRCLILKQRSLWMQGSFKILIENGSKVVSQHLNNEAGTLIHYTGNAPQYVTPPATNPELQQWIDSLIQKGMMQEGISDMQATGQAPQGVDSGKAMRTLDKIGDDRHLFRGQMMEEFVLEIARQAIEVVKEIYKDEGSYEVNFPQTNFMESVDWGDIDLDNDEYWLKAYPTSSLADDLTGRLAEVQEMMQAGMITPRLGKKLMSMPDLEMADSLDNATYDYACKMIEDLLFDGKSIEPEQFNDLQLAMELSIKYYNYAKLHNCPEKKLQKLRDFMTLINDLTGVNAPPPPPGMPVPQAVPEAPPTSNMIPNVPGGVQ